MDPDRLGELPRDIGPERAARGDALARPGVRLAVTAVLVLDVIALLSSLARNHATSAAVLPDFLSYFTIQTNLMAIIVLAALLGLPHRSSRWEYVRGAVTSYAVVTCIVYELLLAPDPWNLTAHPDDSVMHVLTPIALVSLWILVPPRRRIGIAAATGWLCYPVGYAIYTLLRGALVGWYPYFFLDPSQPGGYPQVATGCCVLIGLISVVAVAVAAVPRARTAR